MLMSPNRLLPVLWIDTALAGWMFLAGRALWHRVQSRRWPTVTGHVESAEPVYVRTPDRPGIQRAARIAYRYRVGDQDYRSTTLGRGADALVADPDVLLHQYPLGRKVEVHYDPARPARAVLRPGTALIDWALFATPIAGLIGSTWWFLFR